MSVATRTFRLHVLYMALRAPAFALTVQLASFVAIRSLGASAAEAVLISMALPLGNLLTVFLSHRIARNRRLPYIYWPDLIGFSLLFLVALITPGTPPIVFVVVVILAIMLRAPTVAAMSGIIRENYPAHRRGATMGKVQSGGLAMMAASGLAFGWWLELDDEAYRVLFPLTALFGLLAIFAIRRVPEGDPANRGESANYGLWDLWRVLQRDRHFLSYEISFFIFGLAALSYNALLPLYLAEDLQVEYDEAAIALSVISQVLTVATSPLWGRLIDRVNMLLLRGCFNLVWAMCPLVVFLFDSKYGVYLGQVLVGTIQGGSMLIWTLGVNLFARQADVPVYMGVHQALQGVRGLMAPVAAILVAKGIASYQGIELPAYREVFLLCSIVMVGAGIFMIWESNHMARKGRATTFVQSEARQAAGS